MLLIGCSSKTPDARPETPSPISISGKFVISFVQDCVYNPFGVSAHTQVIVRDGDDAIVAVGELGQPQESAGSDWFGTRMIDCIFPFEITEIPDAAAFYTLGFGELRSPIIRPSSDGNNDICLQVSGAGQSLPPELCTESY